ncbi:HAD family hydrolase [Natronosporangium hydrolyticum]|uniref:HAD family hydrolase n=1 Tax=Natronosporangium hydrolyticum TaxID=2811111 RepID=A0A895YLW5_9ACTN|nr:HAD family hydrolase [Natronosporangium hydrolyticum]QSB16469.1 HAD family hydrolase [Natronosporangium hydrolyticum]
MPLAIFDLDNTLVDRAGSFTRWARAWVTEQGLDPAEVEWLTEADGDGFVPRAEFMAAVRHRYGLATPVSRLVADYQPRIVESLVPDPGVPAALAGLRTAGWRVAIATNGGTYQQQAKIEKAGLADAVDAIAISEEVGVKKPDRRMFEVAAARCGAELVDGWMVGDCPARDIAGGHAVGLKTVWLRRGRPWVPGQPPPQAAVDDVPTAVAAIVNWPGAAAG